MATLAELVAHVVAVAKSEKPPKVTLPVPAALPSAQEGPLLNGDPLSGEARMRLMSAAPGNLWGLFPPSTHKWLKRQHSKGKPDVSRSRWSSQVSLLGLLISLPPEWIIFRTP